MNITNSVLQPGQFGAQLLLDVAGLDPNTTQVAIPLVAIVDRRALHTVKPCQPGHETCTCMKCQCCQQVIKNILEEHFVRLNPNNLSAVNPAVAKKCAQIGGIPGKTWCEQCQAIEDSNTHATPQTAPDLSHLFAA